MTKKHFIALADAIREHNGRLDKRSLGVFRPEHLDLIAEFCASQNPHFKRERWLGYIAGTNGKNGGSVRAK